ncbi:hypothetical protein KIN20_003387 [Parelaphostrongylus tenuis]|uniref:Uncharacterized protein n=1 Tax=Parelaphostrongylus tenuis TaxID=148309 RepID=A0AAD5M1D6_PARTN|nr:hypothetical protein KIN20_003387 [Parelaphostrongylus tenuis]
MANELLSKLGREWRRCAMGGLVRSMDWSFAIHGPTTTRVERLRLVRAAAGDINGYSHNMARLLADFVMISLFAPIWTVFGCGVMPAGQEGTRPFTVTGFTTFPI